jgi:hypothetical protein
MLLGGIKRHSVGRLRSERVPKGVEKRYEPCCNGGRGSRWKPEALTRRSPLRLQLVVTGDPADDEAELQGEQFDGVRQLVLLVPAEVFPMRGEEAF